MYRRWQCVPGYPGTRVQPKRERVSLTTQHNGVPGYPGTRVPGTLGWVCVFVLQFPAATVSGVTGPLHTVLEQL
eukprot:2224195-Rhodomonas_salina.1